MPSDKMIPLTDFSSKGDGANVGVVWDESRNMDVKMCAPQECPIKNILVGS